MSLRSPRRRRRSRRLVRTRGIGAIVAVLVVGIGAAAIGLWLTQPPQPDPGWLDAENTVVVAPAAEARSAPGDDTRPNYRYSIVEGGVHAGIEMRQAIERDSVVAAHYAGLDPSQFRVERLPVRTEAHVSYRIGPEVFWTRKKLVLEAGEKVLTDGTNIIRARCGNRVSIEEVAPVRGQEPAADTFEEISESPAFAAEPPADLAPLGALVAAQRQSLPFGGPTGSAAYGPMVIGAGYGSRPDQPETGAGVDDPGAGSDPAPPLDQRSPSGSDPDFTPGTNPIPDPGPDSGPGPGLEPWPDPGPHPGSGMDRWSDPGLDPGPGLKEGPGSPLGTTRTPEPTPEPSTMVLTGLGAAGWYLARVRRRARAVRTSSDHAFR